MKVPMKNKGYCISKRYDLVVVGGGIAGTVAAIVAARHGLNVGFLQNRPVLGGVSSNEFDFDGDGTWVVGADVANINRNARETGILEEFKMTSKFRKGQGWGNLWSIILREAVENEQKITLYMNTEAVDVEMESKERIKSVVAYQLGTQKKLVLSAEMFIDATGDGHIGYCAGAEYRMGREARSEFNEGRAPVKADKVTMGTSIEFHARDVGHPVKFVPPKWAFKFPTDESIPFRNHDDISQGYWWLEYGGELDTILDNEKIYKVLLRVVFGIWDHVKNHGNHGADNYVIDWISPIGGKRESRRFVGDYILNQNDVERPKTFPDRVAYGGWPIDLHSPKGIFDKLQPAENPFLPGIYSIPFRCLYSKNIVNLMMAGRDISSTHVAFGSTRVMATCGVEGQAVGTAAAICKKYKCTPRCLYRNYISELQQTLLKDDCYIINIKNEDPDNITLNARVTASSIMPLYYDIVNVFLPLDKMRAQMFYINDYMINKISLKLINGTESDIKITAGLRKARKFNDFSSRKDISKATAILPAKSQVWVDFKFDILTKPGELYWICLNPCNGVCWCYGHKNIPGYAKMIEERDTWEQWKGSLCFHVFPDTSSFIPENIVNGIARPEEWPNIWISDPFQPMPQYVEIDLGKKMTFNKMHIVFDTNLDELIPIGPVPQCVRDYSIYYKNGSRWILLHNERHNHLRFRQHNFKTVISQKLKIEITATNGDPTARIYEVRVYRVPVKNKRVERKGVEKWIKKRY